MLPVSKDPLPVEGVHGVEGPHPERAIQWAGDDNGGVVGMDQQVGHSAGVTSEGVHQSPRHAPYLHWTHKHTWTYISM